MFTTFLMAAVLFTLIAVAGTAVGVYLFAEAKWNKHPLARCSYRRAASFASA
ncbi:hypothetical protein Herbaro_21095 [Herbaspirillum sp. WKF16]|jgi:hypothetical protein|uniref:hypothetical protein n=1 Tax=Herbaspirillum sp. WKF16 TaxID=3028312 RepID=UPI0023A932BB|nr:hypothetical protein [Herbaspirillum sp. WKF16]WDZ95941.1 hypothetical protein Herbaro_21095 [Herbaspirillum sp. WKF16]